MSCSQDRLTFGKQAYQRGYIDMIRAFEKMLGVSIEDASKKSRGVPAEYAAIQKQIRNMLSSLENATKQSDQKDSNIVESEKYLETIEQVV